MRLILFTVVLAAGIALMGLASTDLYAVLGDPPVEFIPEGSSDVTDLSSDEIAAAKAIAEADTAVRSITESTPYTFVEVGRWVNDAFDPIGAMVELSWSGPISLERGWTVVSTYRTQQWFNQRAAFCDCHPISYITETVNYRADNVTGLLISVDLNYQRVAAIQADAEAELTPIGAEDIDTEYTGDQ